MADKKERNRIADGLGKTFEEVLDKVNKAKTAEELKTLFSEEELKNLGVKEGDSVKILDWEFEWYE